MRNFQILRFGILLSCRSPSTPYPMAFNEDSRVKIPTLLHLIRMGYNYLSLKEIEWDVETNIVLPVFYESLERLNPRGGSKPTGELL